MKVEFIIYRVMNDGFEDLIWNGNSLFGYLKWIRRTKETKNKVSYILVRGLWMPNHLTAINIKLIHSVEALQSKKEKGEQ